MAVPIVESAMMMMKDIDLLDHYLNMEYSKPFKKLVASIHGNALKATVTTKNFGGWDGVNSLFIKSKEMYLTIDAITTSSEEPIKFKSIIDFEMEFRITPGDASSFYV